MILACALLLSSLLQEKPIDILERLGVERYAFNEKVVHQERYYQTEKMYTMALDQHVLGYWPQGVSDRRYLVYNNSQILPILYQKIKDGKAYSLWKLDVAPSTAETEYKGTLALMLAKNGVAPVGKITESQRASLNAVKSFAVYEYHGIVGEDLRAWVLRPDGTDGPLHNYIWPRFIPVIADEAELLGLGRIY